MAESKTKKTTAKKEAPVVSEAVATTVEENKIEQVETEVKTTEEALQEIAENVEAVIVDDIKNDSKEIAEQLKPIEEIAEEALNFEETKTNVQKAIASEPEKAAEIIQNSIKQAEEIKAKIVKKVNNNHFTSMWNGMNYDF